MYQPPHYCIVNSVSGLLKNLTERQGHSIAYLFVTNIFLPDRSVLDCYTNFKNQCDHTWKSVVVKKLN